MVVYNPSDGAYRGPLSGSPYTGPATRYPNGMPIPGMAPSWDDGAQVVVDDGATVVRPKPPKDQEGNSQTSNGGGRGRMTFREFIEYQNQATQAASAADARTQRQGVYDWVRSSFDQWGMPDGFADSVINIVQDARSPEQAMTMIRDTPQYRERFAGNIARAEAGFGMLSEAQYLAMESSYRGSMHAAGLPKGFYDDPSDFAKFISQDVSPEEVAARAEIAGNLAQTKDPQLWKELESRGISKGDAAAYMLDPDRALPAIQKKLASADIGVAAREAGISFGGEGKQMHNTIHGPAGSTGRGRGGNAFENMLADKGVTGDQARVAFNAVAEDEAGLDALAAQYGEKEFGTKALVKGELGIGGKKAKQRRRDFASRERAAWGGHAGSASRAFGSSNQ